MDEISKACKYVRGRFIKQVATKALAPHVIIYGNVSTVDHISKFENNVRAVISKLVQNGTFVENALKGIPVLE